MQRRFLLALLASLPFASLRFADPAQAAQVLYVQDTNDGYLNLRAGPGSSTGIRLRLTAGTELVAFEQRGNWLHVRLPDSTEGWVFGDYVATGYVPARSYDVAVVPTQDGYLNLRSGPGTKFRILRRLHAGQRLFALNRSGEWLQVRLPEGTTGWASVKFLRGLH